MVKVKFLYSNSPRMQDYEVIITSFANLVSEVIELPEIVEVCLQYMDKNVYGGIDKVRINRLGINLHLPLNEVPKILAHELIHVNQKHSGILKIDRNGVCYWHGTRYTDMTPEDFSYDEYMQLPWEVDVQNRLDKVFIEALRLNNNT